MRIKVTARNETLVLQSAKTLDERVEQALATGLARGLQYASGIAQKDYLSGPRPAKLDVRTSRLRNSISTEVIAGGKKLTGRIGSNVAYAAFHEFGFHGDIRVPAHHRVHRVWNAKTGKPMEIRRGIFDLGRNLIGFKESRGAALARLEEQKRSRLGFATVMVKSHKRQVDYAGRPYIAPALKRTDFKAELESELKALKNQSRP